MVTEYLLAEMLDRQPADVQDLLLRTSLLDRVNSELADVLTGRPGSERILLELEDANAFVVSLDPGRTWFRYHHLGPVSGCSPTLWAAFCWPAAAAIVRRSRSSER